MLTAPSLLVAATTAAAVCACSPGETVVTSSPVPEDPGAASVGHPHAGDLATTDEQREFLEALAKAGVHPSSDLMALSIGSYICQAHGAGQSDQAVRDFVLPLIRGDLRDAHPDVAATAMTNQVDAVTSVYMRVATDRLC
ncbi:DUF732 domain-containing protein [[Mycobacterium] wendilense]|uniref:DUF732 domain-containing protein n=1 Tax=[Mycobacterium] wendilense TaxID=3064284 RepID=A0ABM9M853_9MYCO|nr:DUF732 domain-containing protein [Mycolicibacterium sp. MU0050]CAJ1578594.1 DUF732 domain-containing protein [Mycolicibacterium sp. MU0050]